MANETEMTLWEHLDELRSRIIKVVLVLVVTTALSTVFTQQGLEILISPLGAQIPQTIKPTESFSVYFRIALLGGVTLSMPMIIYQAIRFILPGLLPNERKYLFYLLPWVPLCFASGVAFAVLIVLPAAINFMQRFLDTVIENRWTLDNYIAFVTRAAFWMGVVFQTPLLILLLAKLHIVTPRQLARYRKYAVLVIAIIAAIITPTPDPVNMGIVMVPLYLLYEVGILLAKIAVRGREGEVQEVIEAET